MENDTMTTSEVAQSSDLSAIKRKTHFKGTVIKTTLAGAVVDIGLEVPGVVHISQLRAEPVNRVEEVVKPGQQVDVWVHRVVPKKKRIELTMIKPLDLEWGEIQADMVVKGKVTRLEKFGAFVDIGAERPGLVHISEMTHEYIKSPSEVVKEGDEVEVKVLSVDRRKKQIKLSMKALEEPPVLEAVESRPKRQNGPAIPQKEESSEEEEESVPTAMEIALRQAMLRSQEQQATRSKASEKPKRKGATHELEEILQRTLQQKKSR